MNPDQIARVRRVIAEIERHPDFGARFYGRLFAEAPQTRALFGGDLARQQRALVAELHAMVELLDDLPSLDERARALGERHRGYGVRAVDHRTSRELMASTIDDVLGPASFGPEDRAAWLRAWSLISELMQST